MASSISISVSETGKGSRVYDIDSDLGGQKTLEELVGTVRKLHIATAKTVRREAESDGFDKKARTRVDGRFGKLEEEVRPFGNIEYYARVDASFALIKIFEALELRSPVVTGQYASGNVVFINGTEVARSSAALRLYLKEKNSTGGLKDSDKIRFVNVNPYARKLENLGVRRGTRGKLAGQNHSAGGRRGKARKTGNIIKLPNGAYFLTYKVFKRQFRQIASFMNFSFMPNGTDGIHIQASGKFRNTFKKDGRPYLYPSIVFRLSGEGIIEGDSFE